MAFISNGNTKIGLVPNVSLTPIKSCRNPSASCMKDCYALNAYKMYPDVRKHWDANFYEAETDRNKYFLDIRRYLLKHNKPYFRWHVAGDILDQDYFDRMKILAFQYWFIKFLVFTKMYHLDFSHIPKNLFVFLSIWPDIDIPDTDLPLAFVQDGTETRITNARTCHNNCKDCNYKCWQQDKLRKNLILPKH